jgi:hypothetical protein
MHRNPNLIEESVNSSRVGDLFMDWAQQQPAIRVLVMIGSRARDRVGAADDGSDWDFQVLTNNPDLFLTGDWACSAGLSKPIVYVTRPGRLGRVTKMSAIFENGELDLALIPFRQLRFAKWLLALRLASPFDRIEQALAELGMVLLPGYRVLKGGPSWHRFFRRVTSQISPQRLDDHEICSMAEAFVCDYVSTRRKIIRGELMAAQRWLHCQLAETNFRLLHELRLRLNEPSFPDARRIELLSSDHWREAVSVNALLERKNLLDAVERSAKTCRELTHSLVGPQWVWPRSARLASLHEHSVSRVI